MSTLRSCPVVGGVVVPVPCAGGASPSGWTSGACCSPRPLITDAPPPITVPRIEPSVASSTAPSSKEGKFVAPFA